MSMSSANTQSTSSRRLWLIALAVMGICIMLISQLYKQATINRMALALASRQRLPATSALFADSRNVASFEAYLQGIGLLMSGEFDAAVIQLRLSAVQSRRDLSQWFLLQALTRSSQTEEASSLLNTMQLDADALANMAQKLDHVDDSSLIHLLIEEAVERGGGSLGNIRWMGLWCLSNGCLPLGIQMLESVSTHDDDYLWSQLGWAYYLSRDYERAVQAFKYSVTLEPEATLYRLRLSQAYQARNQDDDRLIAQKILEALVSDHPNADAETWYTLGWNHYLLGKATNAIAVFEKVTDMAPLTGLYRLRLAQALVQRGQVDDINRATAILRQLVLDEPGLTEAVDLLSRLDN